MGELVSDSPQSSAASILKIMKEEADSLAACGESPDTCAQKKWGIHRSHS